MRALVTDMLWPCKVGAFRMDVINGAIRELEADIAVINRHNLDLYCPQFALHAEDWDERVFPDKDEYDMLVYDERYNEWGNLHNDASFDGCRWNGLGHGCISYLFRHKKHRNDDVASTPQVFDWKTYDVFFHVFLGMMRQFTMLVPGCKDESNPKQHWLLLYPGGEMDDPESARGIAPGVNLFITQAFVEDAVMQHGVEPESHRIIRIPWGCELGPCEAKVFHPPEVPLQIAFVCAGNPTRKGRDLFEAIADKIAVSKFSHLVHFVNIGSAPSSPSHPNIENKGIMEATTLRNYLKTDIDIFFNGDNGTGFDGWPLGAPHLVDGCAFFTTDPLEQNGKYLHLEHGKHAVILGTHDTDIAVEFIERFAIDREAMRTMARSGQLVLRSQIGEIATLFPYVTETGHSVQDGTLEMDRGLRYRQ